MAKKRKAPPALDLYALDPAAKRSIAVEARRAKEIKEGPRFAARPKSTGSLSRPRRGGIERTADRLYEAGLPLSVTDAIKSFDRNLLGADETAQSIRNVMNDEAGAGDYVNLALATPIGALALKPVEAGVKRLGSAAMRGGRRALGTRAGRYLTEARPLADNIDEAVEAAFTVTPGAPRRITDRRPRVQGLPAPAQRLGLPAPGPGLPDYAAKPRGGNWWPAENAPSVGQVFNPANVARERIYLGQRFSSDPKDKAFVDWWDRALPRYLQNDFATPDDPLRALADQGYLQGVENAAQWSNSVKNDIAPMPLQKLLFDPETERAGLKAETLSAMPWVNKLPATENIYGLWPSGETLGRFSHIKDELVNALRSPEVSGLPEGLAVRPESLARMSFPQAVERVGRINQWRAKQQEQVALSAMDSPALSVFKEYGDDPRGMRWVELRAPDDVDTSGFDIRYDPIEEGYVVTDPSGRTVGVRPTVDMADELAAQTAAYNVLEGALRYEGDTMGHCVGGYCDDVVGGRSRIFSLRDAKGEPHVTIETGRGSSYVPPEVYDQWKRQADEELRRAGIGANDPTYWDELDRRTEAQRKAYLASDVENIVQIKGKQNRAPKEDYLPFVQDFVKGGQWGQVGDLGNTGLVKLPDGRYITKQQMEEGLGRARERHFGLTEADLQYDSRDNPEAWAAYAPYFEGFARGGRALAAKPCSCDKSLAVR